jgi:hypothetical protein
MPRHKLHFLFVRRFGHPLWQWCSALVVAALLVGCAPAPVQEMSEARQAIEAARAAGAEQHARPQLDEAHSLLDTAQQMLNHRRFRDARRSASQARDAAIRARETAEGVSEQE